MCFKCSKHVPRRIEPKAQRERIGFDFNNGIATLHVTARIFRLKDAQGIRLFPRGLLNPPKFPIHGFRTRLRGSGSHLRHGTVRHEQQEHGEQVADETGEH